MIFRTSSVPARGSLVGLMLASTYRNARRLIERALALAGRGAPR